MFGLKQEHIDAINQCFSMYPSIEQVIVYGSRAMGSHRDGSDIDLTIEGQLVHRDLLRLENQIDDLLLPYKIDLSLKQQISNPDLIDHIHRVGKVFYARESETVLREPPSDYSAQLGE
jgi:predicted nucleotidyltransferase